MNLTRRQLLKQASLLPLVSLVPALATRAAEPVNELPPGWPPYRFDLETMKILILSQAPLYLSAVKHQLPQPVSRTIQLYQPPVTSSTTVSVINEYTDYQLFEEGGTEHEVSKLTERFAGHIAAILDQSIFSHQEEYHRTMGFAGQPHVVDIFEHVDGSPNLDLREVHDHRVTVMDPMELADGWLAYRFKFAVVCL